ncbi:hypothetical protein BDV93DRAFT_548658 [Ceratobasidium sp. AG-I]|nr:hypothetical protein BDV93DRAFT_548658 [Ceratobasidium sp. AG-I]
MSILSNIIPLPGFAEIDGAIGGIARYVKSPKHERDECAELQKRLESFREQTDRMNVSPEFAAQLDEIYRDFQSSNATTSRNRAWRAGKRLEIWAKLNDRLDTMRDTALGSLQYDHEVVRVVLSYEITNEVQIHSKIWVDAITQRLVPVLKPPRITLRLGQYEKRSVVYVTIVSDPSDSAHKLVNHEANRIIQLLHVNIAKLVGVTQTGRRLDGLVVAMDGLKFEDFSLGTHSGGVWAKCIRGFEDFVDFLPESPFADHVTVTADGHVTMLPVRSSTTQVNFASVWYNDCYPYRDPAVQLLMRVYGTNHNVIPPDRLRTFVDSLAELGLAFTELQVLDIAATCELFPFDRFHFFGYDLGQPMPYFQPQVGEFGRACYTEGRLMGWESLKPSRHVQNTPGPEITEAFSKTPIPGGAQWLTYALYNPCLYIDFGECPTAQWVFQKQIERPYKFLWSDIFQEAQEIFESFADLGSISFCYRINFAAELKRPDGASWHDLPQLIYYHRNPRSPLLHEVRGYFSASNIPDHGVWQERLKRQNWGLEFRMDVCTYNLCDDWGLQSERARYLSMMTIPGHFPGAQIGGELLCWPEVNFLPC